MKSCPFLPGNLSLMVGSQDRGEVLGGTGDLGSLENRVPRAPCCFSPSRFLVRGNAGALDREWDLGSNVALQRDPEQVTYRPSGPQLPHWTDKAVGRVILLRCWGPWGLLLGWAGP